MLSWLRPGRTADRLILRVCDVSDEMVFPSVFANSVTFEWMDAMAEAEGFTSSAKDAAQYALRAGYALRFVEEVEATARPLDDSVIARLQRARTEAPERRQREVDAVIHDPDISDFDRSYLEQVLSPHDDAEYPYAGEREVLDELIVGEGVTAWVEGQRFFDLSGYGREVWQIFVLQLTGVLNRQLEQTWAETGEEEGRFPWEAVEQLVRFGYVLRCGDAFNGYTPEHIAGGDWSPDRRA